MIETDDGVFLRRIRPPTTLAGDHEIGSAAEEATRSAAAVYGLPDFVFRPMQRRRGSGTRELGDAIVVAGEVGAVIQVKARSTPTTDEEKERAWIGRAIRKASRQATGTIRAMTATATTLMNERGRPVEINGPGKSWIPVVVIDHPRPSRQYVPGSAESAGAVVLLRRDWEFLFEQLKSTDAVIRYLHRVHALEPVRLGSEPVRYYELAAADVAAEPGEIDERLQRPGVELASVPFLPQAPAGADDRRFHLLLRSLLEDVATTPRPPAVKEEDMVEVLAAVDTLPVGYRTELGATLMSWIHDVTTVGEDQTRWRFRHVEFPDRPHLIFAAATRWDEAVYSGFMGYVTLRHQQLLERLGEPTEQLSVGVLLTPRHDGRRPWDTTLAAARGDLELESGYRRELEELWPTPQQRAAMSQPDESPKH